MAILGEKMKILFFINNLRGGGAEKVLTDIVNHLDPNLYDITVRTVDNDGVYIDQLKPHVKYSTIVKKPTRIKSALFWRVAKILPARWMYRFCIRDEYDVEIAFLEGLPTKILSGCDRNCLSIAWVHTDLHTNNAADIYYTSVEKHKQSYLSYDKIVCVSKTAKKQFIKHFGETKSIDVIYNLIDTQQIIEKSKALLMNCDVADKNIPIMCSVGRLTPVKGYDRLLRVHKRLIDSGFNHRLWIIGDGSERKALEKYIMDNQLQSSVKLWGFCENPYPILRNADLFVCSSFAEGYPLVVAEALVLRKPVVSTYCTGPNEILNEGEYGLLVENDEDSLYAGLASVLSDNDLFGELCVKAEIGSRTFQEEKIIKQIENLF